MTDPSSSWTELRYAATQALPEDNGLRDELDGITMWTVTAVQCFHDQPEQQAGHGEVAVFDLEAGLDLRATATAWGGQVESAAKLLLTADGAVDPGLPGADIDVDVDKIVLFLGVQIGRTGRSQGIGLLAALAIQERLGSRRSLIGCYPEPGAYNATDPEFFEGVPEPVRQKWWARGLAYRGDGLWLLPSRPRSHGAGYPEVRSASDN